MQQEGMSGSLSLAEEVTEILRDRIIGGEYAMGEKLTESKIAAELKVSRTPVRDAFRELEKEQLIEYIPHKGCFARGFSQEDMKDIYAVRKEVEQLAIQWAIDRANYEAVYRLEKQLEKMKLFTETLSRDKLLWANEEFHNMIFSLTRSRFIVHTLKNYQEYVHFARMQALKRDENLPEIYREHEAIFQAVANRDKEAAVRAIAVHLDASARRAMLRPPEGE